MTLPTQDIDEVLRKNERDLFLARNSVENLRQNVERLEEELAAAEARADALAQEVERLKAEIETYRTAFDGIEPSDRADELEEAKRLLANSLKEYAPISAASHRSEVQDFLARAALREKDDG